MDATVLPWATAVIDIWGHKLVFYGFSYISKVQLNELAVHFCTIKYTIIHPSNQGDINKTSIHSLFYRNPTTSFLWKMICSPMEFCSTINLLPSYKRPMIAHYN